MTSPIDREDQLRRVLAEAVPEWEGDFVTPQLLTRADHVVSERQLRQHRVYHAETLKRGAIVWGMRQQGMTWRQIYDQRGIIQRNGARWMDLFLAEGIDPGPPEELDRRHDGTPEGGA